MTVTTGRIMRYKTKNRVLFKCKIEYKNNPAIQAASLTPGVWGADRYNHWDFWDDADNKWEKSDFYKKGNFAYIRLPG